jgi:CheY-like chemotaxis protein
MLALNILVADDQIPPDIPESKFRESILNQYGDTSENRAFFKQCMFMGKIVESLRDHGHSVTAARTFQDAQKQISDREFDLAIIDLGWFMDSALPKKDRPAAGWDLCKQLDAKDQQSGKRTPQIVFSSRFPKEPELSEEAAKSQKLPLFKEATPNARNSLIAAVGFVEATLEAQRANPGGTSDFERELRNIALRLFNEPLRDYRQWALLTLIGVGASLFLVLAGVALVLVAPVAHAFTKAPTVGTLSAIASLITATVSGLLFKRLNSAKQAIENLRHEVLKQVEILKQVKVAKGKAA